MANYISTHTGEEIDEAIDSVAGKQDELVSGQNIKTINNESLLGEGNITIDSGISDVKVNNSSVVTEGTANISLKTINNNSIVGTGNISISGGVTSVNNKTGAVTLSASDILVSNSQSIQANLERIDEDIEGLVDDKLDADKVSLSEIGGLTKPDTEPAEKILVGVDTANAQAQFKLGEGLTITGDTSPYTITASGGGGGNYLEKGTESGTNSTATHGATASANNACAFGNGARAGGNNAIAIGNTTTANSSGGIVIGNNSFASGNNSILIGERCGEGIEYSVAIGYSAKSKGGVSIGREAGNTSYNNTIAIGSYTKTNANNTVAIGGGSASYGDNHTKATAVGATAIGYHANASTNYEVAFPHVHFICCKDLPTAGYTIPSGYTALVFDTTGAVTAVGAGTAITAGEQKFALIFYVG